MSRIEEVPVRVPIKLGQFLKLSGLVDSGAQATELIASDDVEVDGSVENRRGRQLFGGEVVTVFATERGFSALVVDVDA